MSNRHEYEFVDLGLPSGTLWATCNVGAKESEDYGEYFAWNEDKGNIGVVADVIYGWHTPTDEEWDELIQNTEDVWNMRNGIYGRLFKANNGQSIFLPASGYRSKTGLIKDVGVEGNYWSSSLFDGPGIAYSLHFFTAFSAVVSDDMTFGFSVRPVRSVE